MTKRKRRRARKTWKPGMGSLLLGTLLAVTLAGGIYRIYLYHSYQPARCQIIEKQLVTRHSTGKNGRDYYSYVPEILYTMITSAGHQEVSDTYAGPVDPMFREESEVQAILDHYEVDHTYPCWYSPVAVEHAALVLQGDSSLDTLVRLLVTWGGGGIALGVVAWMCVERVYKPWLLLVRGLITQGGVVYYQGEGKRRHSRIAFKTLEEQPKHCKTRGSQLLAIGSTVQVIYDPLNPYNNARVGGRPMLLECIAFSFLALFLAAITALLLIVIWLIPF